ncbi:unnamed protein product [Boreogadus saida]
MATTCSSANDESITEWKDCGSHGGSPGVLVRRLREAESRVSLCGKQLDGVWESDRNREWRNDPLGRKRRGPECVYGW